MAKGKNKGIKISDKTAGNIIISFFAAFSTYFFIPFDLYIANIWEISIPTVFIIETIIAVSIAVFTVSFLILRFTKGTLNYICSSLIFAVTLAFYIQSSFLSVGMGELNGEQYAPGTVKMILNALLWVALISAVFVFHRKKEKMYEKAASYLSSVIILIEIITISVSAVTAAMNGAAIGIFGNRYKSDISQVVCTTEYLNTYSTEKNIIMIVADSYDSFTFDALMEAHPETLSEFDGFTYYTNTIGIYPGTKYSLSHIFTHNENVEVRDIYSNDRFFKSISENYSINLYSFIFDDKIFEKYAQNYFLVNYSQIEVGIKELSQVGKIFCKAAMFKAMPEAVKQYFQVNSDSFSQVITSDDEYSIYSYDNLDFLGYLTEEPELTEEKQFKFIYINGIHEPRRINADLERTDNDVDIEESAAAVNKLLSRYLHMLKQGNGKVYDNSDILILADHGSGPDPGAAGCKRQFPMIMFKPAHAQSSGITVSNAPISYTDLYPTLLKLSGEEPEERTIFDIDENEQRTRYFYVKYNGETEEFTENIK